MSDQGFHEIQLSAKQLVFLFMAGVVVAVGVFLLGVSVGRGVRSSVASAADAGAPGDTMANASTPTATKVTSADLDYREKLQGAAGAAAAGAVVGAAAAAATPPPAKPVDPPQPAPDGPPADTKPPLKPAPNSTPLSIAATPAAKAAATPPAAKPVAPKPTPAASKPAATDGSWTVQLDAFSNKATADNLVKQLKAKGYASAFIVSSASLYKVRVGTFTDHGDADKMASRLAKDGYRPLVTR